MKTILIVPLLLLSACASQPPRKIVIVPEVAGQSVPNLNAIRASEEVRAYRFGRYADPGDRTVMHEAHPVYRIEKSASWNLRPDGTRPAEISSAAVATERDALVAELNRQKTATKNLTEQALSLNQQWASVNTTMNQTKTLAEQNQILLSEVAALKQRVEATETQVRSNAPKTTATPEEKW